MSGGRYDYACFAADLEDLTTRRRGLEEIADRLGGLSEADFPGAHAAAVATHRLLIQRQVWDAYVESTCEVLSSVWRAVEWTDSGDWGEGSIAQALDAMLQKAPQEPGNRHESDEQGGGGGS